MFLYRLVSVPVEALPEYFDPSSFSVPQLGKKSLVSVVLESEEPFPDKSRLIAQLYQMLETEFSYKGNTAPLKAWGYANSRLLSDLEKLGKVSGIRANIALLNSFSNVKDLLSPELQNEFSNQRTPLARKKQILNSLVDCPLDQVTSHNCYGIILYAAALADIISGKGVHRLLNEITAPAHERIGGGLIAHPGIGAPFCITHTIENITVDDLDALEECNPQPGELIVFSVPGSGTHIDIEDTRHCRHKILSQRMAHLN